MLICSKCGNELKEGSVFCNKCGEPVEIAKASSVPDMNLEESIEFADKLKNMYVEVEKLEHEVADHEARISKPLSLDYRFYSFFRFFWKYLVWAAVSFFVMDFLALITMRAEGAMYFFFAMMFISPIVLLIVGVINAGKRRDEENAAIFEGNERAKRQRVELEKDTAELKSKLAIKKRELAKEEVNVPEDLRKSSSMSAIKTLLQSGKASSLQEAITTLRK